MFKKVKGWAKRPLASGLLEDTNSLIVYLPIVSHLEGLFLFWKGPNLSVFHSSLVENVLFKLGFSP